MVWFSQFGPSTSPAHTTPWAVHRPGQIVSCSACLGSSVALYSRLFACCFLCLLVCLHETFSGLCDILQKHHSSVRYATCLTYMDNLVFRFYTITECNISLFDSQLSIVDHEFIGTEWRKMNNTWYAGNWQKLADVKRFYFSLIERDDYVQWLSFFQIIDYVLLQIHCFIQYANPCLVSWHSYEGKTFQACVFVFFQHIYMVLRSINMFISTYYMACLQVQMWPSGKVYYDNVKNSSWNIGNSIVP